METEADVDGTVAASNSSPGSVFTGGAQTEDLPAGTKAPAVAAAPLFRLLLLLMPLPLLTPLLLSTLPVGLHELKMIKTEMDTEGGHYSHACGYSKIF